MMSKLIAIGDVHGSLDKLKSLIQNIKLEPDDRIRFLGDLINRGPNSKGVIDFIIDLSKNYDVKCIMGNHEEMLLISRLGKSEHNFWLKVGGRRTLDSYGIQSSEFANGPFNHDLLPPEHLVFYSRMHDYLVEDDFILIHASVKYHDDMDRQLGESLRWGNLPVRGHKSGKVVVCGHTTVREPIINDKMIAIDTGSYKHGGYITAIDLTSTKLWRSDVGTK